MEKEEKRIDKATNSFVGSESRASTLCVFGASLMRTVAADKKYINGFFFSGFGFENE